jgi:hypothetical protein
VKLAQVLCGAYPGEEAVIVAATVLVVPGNLSGVVYAHRVGKDAACGIDRGVGTEALIVAATVDVISGDLSVVVDALRVSEDAAWRSNRRVGAVAVNETVLLPGTASP